MTDMNSGYNGYSMSKRASRAYADGEMPKSKWTKRAMIDALKDYCELNDRAYDASVEKMTKAELFERMFTLSSWHHTSKMVNATDFYGINEREACEIFPPMTREQVDARIAAEDVEQAEREAAIAHLGDLEAQCVERFGHGPQSLGAYMALHPESVQVRVSKKGKTIYSVGNQSFCDDPHKQALDCIVNGFDARKDLGWM